MHDLIIIGSSAAGISAGIYAARAGVKFLVISQNGGNLSNAGVIENYLGVKTKTGLELLEDFKEHLDSYRPEIIQATVQEIVKQGLGFSLKTNKGKFSAKSIIIASGAYHQKLNIPGEEKFKNKGISYCETCDGPLFKDKNISIIGGGNAAIKAALSLAKIASEVSLFTINSELKGEKIILDKLKNQKNIKIVYNTKTKEFFGDTFLKGFVHQKLDNHREKKHYCDGVFIYVGVVPNTWFIDKSLKLTNEKGEVVINELGQTSVPGIFAAGDVTHIPHRQVSIAAGFGTLAALSAIDYLKKSK